jgi:choline dehydrogenase-like flavoprotein
MPASPFPEDTSFTLDILGRYSVNSLDEALDSADPTRRFSDARPFDHIVIGGGSFGAVLATRLFNLDISHRHRVLVLEAGPLALPEHVQNLPPDFGPPGKGGAGTVWGQPWQSDSPQSFNQGFPGLAFCVGGRSVFWGGWSPYFISSELPVPPWLQNVVDDLSTPVIPPGTPRESYLDEAARLLGTNVTNDFVSGPLHEALRKHVFNTLIARGTPVGADTLTGNRGALTKEDDLEAPLAVSGASERPGFFASNKFSSVQLLFRALRVAQGEAQAASPSDFSRAILFKRLMLVDNCYATRLERVGSRITKVFVTPADYQCINGKWTRIVQPEREIPVPPQGRVVLALGTIENTRLARNAVPEKQLIGRNLMAHLRSNLTFRVPRPPSLDPTNPANLNLPPGATPEEVQKAIQKLRELQVSALFVKGIHTHPIDGSKGHYHFQITASGVGELGMNSEAELFKKIPNIEDLDQFRDLTDKWVVITIRGIGEMTGDKVSVDPQNRVRQGPPDGNGVPVAVVRLETNWSNPTDPRITDPTNPQRTKDNDLWNAMDAAARELAASFGPFGPIEYLSRPNDPSNAHWQDTPPNTDLCRDTLSSTHHEAGTLWMGNAPATSVTDHTGRIWELDNLFVAGPALLPTIGSPNPMLSGVALARRTARHLISPPVPAAVETGFRSLFDGTEGTFQRWKAAGPGSFALLDGNLVAQPGGDHTAFFYAPEKFSNFVLRLQFLLPGPVDQFGKVFGNSGIFVRFRYPHTKWADVNAADSRAAGNPAWVAVATGFEVQIDEQGRPSFFDKHRTGAIYDVPTGQVIGGIAEPADQQFTGGPVLLAMHWYEMEIDVNSDLYIVRLRDAQNPTAAFQQVTRFSKPAGKYQNRGLPAATDPRSGYLGIQAHSGNVLFRHIRIK